MDERVSEAETAMVLNTYMYTDYEFAEDGMSLDTIVKEMPQHIDVNGVYHPQYAILKEAVQNPEIGNLRISHDPQSMGFNEGTNAAVFTSPDNGRMYVVYRGTSDGEWMDNGKGLSLDETAQQKQAVDYFDAVMGSMAVGSVSRIVVTGHSKGANKAQFVTMDSGYSSRIDACYSIDGQGQSKKAISRWRASLGEAEYDSRSQKIYGINGENDYVSVLGTCIIPASHIFYVKTGADPFDFAAYHDITRMFATYERYSDGSSGIVYSGRKNPFVFKRGAVADYISSVSDELMELPEDELNGCAMSAMQIPEIAFGGSKKGLDGTGISLKDIRSFGRSGVPIIAGVLSNTGEGQEFARRVKERSCMGTVFSVSDSMDVSYEALKGVGDILDDMVGRLKNISEELLQSAYRLSFYLDSVLIKEPHIKLCVGGLDSQREILGKRAKILERVAAMCVEFDKGVM